MVYYTSHRTIIGCVMGCIISKSYYYPRKNTCTGSTLSIGSSGRGVHMLKFALFIAPFFFFSCTQETQNSISRSIQNWTGINGVLDVLSDGKLMYRFINIDKLTTARGTNDKDMTRPYRFGYGVFDKNFNYKQDDGEKKVYFEISDFATNYVFYENPE